ncbi:DNA/RNA non-specific endonuclease [Blastococcus sp. TBT05-19]|uniref:DNA/RNA non-specific endonuclease n=1 Tax=Blastococcus sp. TBT05-19 TaxID=2250581 RepID=UPI000DE92CC3|nr:DNA/RNA non-specific endonuclease [Blastococcus sp. TBT05-19]RBY92186.1 DNA/RNA non-specific endonuclease [Blastococcus sp. TBT05-19]
MTASEALRRDDDLSDRRGYDPGFLGLPVPLPALTTGHPTVPLPYTHFTVLHRPDRRLAAVTALAMDGARLRSLDREGIEWSLDPRLPAEQQAGAAVYARNDLDRGHLVRRASACWGRDEAEAEQANADSFHYPNAAPQAALFNQGRQLWLGLEDHVQEHAEVHDRKLVVLAGPVLDPADPPYRGVAIPLLFWKVVAFVQDGALAATGYLLDQTPLVDDLAAAVAEAAAAGDPPPLGAYRTFQVPIADIAAIAGVDLAALAAVDRLPVPAGTDRAPGPGGRPASWVQLGTLDDVRL